MRFHSLTSTDKLPELFTYPFNYSPDKLSLRASTELINYLNKNWKDFFFKKSSIGKMFGVLVVKNSSGQLGYLAAFSGKLADKNDYEHFVPPVFDTLIQEGFYKIGEKELDKLTAKILKLENDLVFNTQKKALLQLITDGEAKRKELKISIKQNKEKRKNIRAQNISSEQNKLLDEESKTEQIELKRFNKKFKKDKEDLERPIKQWVNKIQILKTARKAKSNQLQTEIFEQYTFLNAFQESKSINQIFEETPPAGAGECAAPKLLHYAYQENYKPISMAEFWYGKPPESAVRKHLEFYPACKSKCEPILGHMLVGLNVAPNPIDTLSDDNIKLDILFEDEVIIIVNKPPHVLSVPGKTEHISIEELLKEYVSNYDGPYLVHRLDYSTSGLLIAAKNLKTYKHIQAQFADKTIKKRYIALLDGKLKNTRGKIELPMRVDLENRPQQLVDFTHGKEAVTYYEVIRSENEQTLVNFFPQTGRTHQLRVHAAHQNGLNNAIVGDDLYGSSADRLHLHAEWISFIHPKSLRKVEFYIKAVFS